MQQHKIGSLVVGKKLEETPYASDYYITADVRIQNAISGRVFRVVRRVADRRIDVEPLTGNAERVNNLYDSRFKSI